MIKIFNPEIICLCRDRPYRLLISYNAATLITLQSRDIFSSEGTIKAINLAFKICNIVFIKA